MHMREMARYMPLRQSFNHRADRCERDIWRYDGVDAAGGDCPDGSASGNRAF